MDHGVGRSQTAQVHTYTVYTLNWLVTTTHCYTSITLIFPEPEGTLAEEVKKVTGIDLCQHDTCVS